MEEEKKYALEVTKEEYSAMRKSLGGRRPPKGVRPPQFKPYTWKPGDKVPCETGLRWRSTNKATRFLYFFSLCGSIARACDQAGIKFRHHVYRWKEKDPQFKEAFELAKTMSFDAMEDELIRRGFEGYQRPLSYKGVITKEKDPETGEMVPVTVREYSDKVAMFMLEGARPEKYGKNFQQAPTNITVNIALNEVIQAKLNEIYES